VRGALDWSVEAELFDAFRLASVLALLIGAIGSAFAASWIARRALIPVRELAQAADRIEASRLDEPLDARKAPRELRDLTASLGSMQRRLDASFSRLSAFAGDLAHELRTPLHNLMGEISVTLSRARTDEEYRDVLGSALEECGRLARTIDSLLFLARADRGAVELRATEFDVATEIESLLDYYRLYAEERRITLTRDGSARVLADRDLVRQAVGNLLANAVHYSREGGLVATTIRDDGGNVAIEVRDSGPGIGPEDSERAFDRFYRGGSARKAHPEGSGLGLSIVRSIAMLHGRDASIARTPEGGTLARITLPLEREGRESRSRAG
jgi:two-component system heavy metal sensor histidine kinase CusS